jgi:hypothetical protein
MLQKKSKFHPLLGGAALSHCDKRLFLAAALAAEVKSPILKEFFRNLLMVKNSPGSDSPIGHQGNFEVQGLRKAPSTRTGKTGRVV